MLVGINPYHYHFTDDLDTTNTQIQDLLLRRIIDRDESQTQVNRDAMLLYVEAKIVLLRLHLQSILLQITGCAEIERIVHVRPPGRTSPMVIWRQAGEEIHTFPFRLLG
jgi:hypothetical protein